MTATIPYIRGTSETIARILQPYNIRVAHKPITTLRRLLSNVKDKDKPEDRQEAVYKIKCCDRQATYIGETGRNLCTRSTDRKQTSDEEWRRQQSHCWTPFTDETSNWLGLYDLYYDSITYSTDYYQRRSLESWFTNLEQTPLNRSEQLPAPNKRLIDETK